MQRDGPNNKPESRAKRAAEDTRTDAEEGMLEEDVSQLLTVAEKGQGRSRIAALMALGMHRAKSAGPLFKALLDDADPQIRAHAAVGLIRIGDKERLPQLAGALKNERRDIVIGAALALGFLSDPRFVPNLIRAFQTDDNEVGSAVAWALGQCGSPLALPWLQAALSHGFAAANSCEALGSLRDPTSAQALIAALSSAESAMTRAHAAKALSRLEYSRAQSALPDVYKALKGASEDADRRVRLCAAVALYDLDETYGKG